MRFTRFRSLRIVRSVSVVVSCAALTIWGGTFFNAGQTRVSIERRQEPSTRSVKTDNKTKAFTIIRAYRRGDIVEVELRNDYNKPITGYQVGVGSGTVRTELLLSDTITALAPGAVIQRIYDARPELDRRGLVVLAVLFDDHTGDGDTDYVETFLRYRTGMKMQRQQTIQALQKALSSSAIDMLQQVDHLVSESFRLLDKDMERLPIDVQLEIKQERRRLLRNITASKGTGGIEPQSYRSTLSSLVAGYKETLDIL